MINRIIYLIKSKNINAAKLCTDLDISKSSISDWKKGKGKPSVETSIKMSHYFNVSLDWLITGKEFTAHLPFEDSELLELFHELNGIGRANLEGYARGLLTNNQYTNHSIEDETK
jgi:transcriptional regulator with XRE-family HTH domain